MKLIKLFLALLLVFTTILQASTDSLKEKERQKRIEKQIQTEMEREKKYAKEQVFYQNHNYDFKGAEVNPDSVDSVPDIELQDDFDMDSVYD